MKTKLVLLLTLLLLSTNLVLSEDENLRTKIDQVFETLPSTGDDGSVMFMRFNELAESVGRAKLVDTLIRYSAENIGLDEEGFLFKYIVATKMALPLSQTEILETFVRLLSEDDERVRSLAKRIFLQELGRVFPGDAALGSFLREKGADRVSPKVYKEIFSIDPSRGLFILIRAFDVSVNIRQDLQWKEHLVSTAQFRILNRGRDRDVSHSIEEARNALETLASDEAWWVRLYVAHIATQRGTGRILVNDSLREKLRKDPNELVAEVARN